MKQPKANLDLKRIKKISKKVIKKLKLKERRPTLCLTLGTGFGDFVESRSVRRIRYDKIGLPMTKADGHAGYLHQAKIGDVWAYILQGRVHQYEGWDVQDVVLATRVLAYLGAQTFIFTSAVGSINPNWEPGSLILNEDHLLHRLESPLVGREMMGRRFVDIGTLYTPRLRTKALMAAEATGVQLRTGGVCAGFLGPQFETPAEILAVKKEGATTAGMSTSDAAIAAKHMNPDAEILWISCVTNFAAGVSSAPIDHDNNKAVANAAGPHFSKLVEEFVRGI